MIKSFKYRLCPTDSQIKRLEETFGLCRFLYNCALEERISFYKKYNKSLSYFSQTKLLPEAKALVPELEDIYSQVLQSTLKRLDSAYKSFFGRMKSGERKPGFPRFKNKDRFHSILYPQSGFALSKSKGKIGNKRCKLKLSKIGDIPMRMHRNIKGIIKTCSIIRNTTGKYYVCFSCENVPKEHFPKTGKSIGIDLGVKNLLTLSNGEKISNPKYFKNYQDKLASAQRKLSKMSFRNSRRNATKLHAARLYEHITNQRTDYYHKLSINLLKEYDIICLEDLNIKGMQKDNWRILNREIQNCAWNQLVHMFSYKAESADKKIVLVDPRSTSKMCSACGKIVEKSLSERIHKCECGLEIDRDYNAAINIYNRGMMNMPRESGNTLSEAETSRSPRL
jgi:putative transposase